MSDFQQNEKTHFGYQQVDLHKKSSLVQGIFGNVANKYDLMNDVMSLGIHRIWKETFINMLNPREHTKLLDVAGGTGDIAKRFLQKTNHKGHVTICDITYSMLDEGKKNTHLPIEWICGDAENLPFEDKSFDAYTISFGIRNVTYIHKALEEAYRVLKTGGHFLCLEFSHVNLPIFKNIYDTYSFNLIPFLGELIAKDRNSYQYLVESIRNFPSQGHFKQMIQAVGFENVSYRNLSCGIVAIHSGWKI